MCTYSGLQGWYQIGKEFDQSSECFALAMSKPNMAVLPLRTYWLWVLKSCAGISAHVHKKRNRSCRKTLTQRLRVKVYSDGARNGVGHDQRRGCQVVGTDTVTQAALKVLCARQHPTGNDIALKGRPRHTVAAVWGT